MPDLDQPNALTAAVGWLEGVFLGSVATTLAVIAVATMGFLMITGRIDVRRAAQVVFGCFIIFGASTIASGLMAAARGGGGGEIELANAPPPPQLPAPAAAVPVAPAQPYDPYAGAALPPR